MQCNANQSNAHKCNVDHETMQLHMQRKATQWNTNQYNAKQCKIPNGSEDSGNSEIPGTSRPGKSPRGPQGEPKTGPKGTQEHPMSSPREAQGGPSVAPKELQAGSRTKHRRAPRGAPRKPEDDVRKRGPKEVPPQREKKAAEAHEEPQEWRSQQPHPLRRSQLH